MIRKWRRRSAILDACLLAAALALLAGGGCTRRHYRTQADDQAAALWSGFTRETAQPLIPPTIYVRPESRLFDPTNPDKPPMPPDDPVAHTRMHYIDGKRAYRRWHKYGDTPFVDYNSWRGYLPYNDNGRVVLDLNGAVQVAYVNSRNYQRELEDLYLSALDVSLERFRFDAQFFGGNSTFFTADGRIRGGGNDRSTLQTDTGLSVNKLYAGGGQLVVDLANSIIWQFSNADTNINTTLLNFNFFQPLLRFGGRARILERLTVSERNLLANARLMEQYRQGFYAQVVTGRNPGDGPVRKGGPTANTSVAPGLAGSIAGGVGSGAGGYLGLLQSMQQIRNQVSNVTTLRDSLTRLDIEFRAGRINDKFQVELARQALYQGQSQLLALKTAFEASLDSYKVLLGLPPSLELELDDPILKRFELIDPRVSQLTEDAGRIVLRAHESDYVPTDADLAQLVGPEGSIRSEVGLAMQAVEDDLTMLKENAPRREEQLTALNGRDEVENGDVEATAYSIEAFRERVKSLENDMRLLRAGLDGTWTTLETLRKDLPNLPPAEAKKRLIAIHPDFSSQMLALTLAKARARVDAITWADVDISSEEALEIARINRRDWMNARSNLVDTWRLIEFNANALKSGLNLTMSGDISTVGDNPVNFRSSTGRIRAGLEFDAPLTRLIERNVYRQSLIDYQQARRAYMQFEDQVSQSLRQVLRLVALNQLNFEIRRSAVLVAIQQVDLAREKLSRPLKPGEDAAKYGLERASIGRDLVSALNDLLSTQNDFLNVFVSYEVQRINLDLEMGTMQLDDRGIWIDPGPVTSSGFVGESGEPLPPLNEPIPPLDGVGPPQEFELLPIPPAPAAAGNDADA
jgi:outer membrane protein TolC